MVSDDVFLGDHQTFVMSKECRATGHMPTHTYMYFLCCVKCTFFIKLYGPYNPQWLEVLLYRSLVCLVKSHTVLAHLHLLPACYLVMSNTTSNQDAYL